MIHVERHDSEETIHKKRVALAELIRFEHGLKFFETREEALVNIIERANILSERGIRFEVDGF